MGFNFFEQSMGGQSRSTAKIAAARRNGRKCKKGMGGRPSSRTLIERILNRHVTPEEWKTFDNKVLSKILLGHQQIIPAYFECEWNDIPRKSWRGLPLAVRQTLRHIRATAKIYLPKTRVKPPKDYIVIRVPKPEYERVLWQKRYPDMPFVATRPKKVPITSIFNYDWFDRKFAGGVELSEDDIFRNGEGKLTREVSVALLKYLKFKYKKS